MRQGQIAQQSAEVGSRALDTIEASGINHPGRWARLGGTSFDAVDISDPDHPVRIACPVDTAGTISVDTPDADSDGKADLGLTELENFYSNCHVEFVRCQWPRASGEDVWGKQWRITGGTVIPGGMTTFSNTFLGTSPLPSSQAGDVFVIKRYEPFAIDPLYVATHGAAPAFAPNMKRLTLSNGLGVPMEQPAAEAIFQATDDLLFTPGTDEGIEDESKLPEPPRPAKVDATGNVSPRQFRGEYSWLATFVPVEAAGNYQDGRTYTVSVAVFYKRPLQLPSSATEKTLDIEGSSTRLNCRIEIEASNKDLIFEDNGTVGTWERDVDEKHIKSGLWGLVTYTDTGGTERARWYRLGSVGEPVYDSDTWGVRCRLIGPDFPAGATNFKITFFEGLVAVFERTMQVPELPIGEAP